MTPGDRLLVEAAELGGWMSVSSAHLDDGGRLAQNLARWGFWELNEASCPPRYVLTEAGWAQARLMGAAA